MEKERIPKLGPIFDDPLNTIEHSAKKIAFVREFFTHSVPDDERWSKDAKAGFHQILVDLEDDLEAALHQLLEAYTKVREIGRATGKI